MDISKEVELMLEGPSRKRRRENDSSPRSDDDEPVVPFAGGTFLSIVEDVSLNALLS